MYASKQIMQLVLYFLLIISFFALIGWKMIGDLGIDEDPYNSNFSNYFRGFNILYIMISFDGFPICMFPSYEFSPWFALFFLTVSFSYILIFLPIPIAFLFQAYRNNRSILEIEDRIKQRQALLFAFISLDTQNDGILNENQFFEFISEAYLFKSRYMKRIRELYLNID